MISFFLSFISVIGFYPLFYRLNKPAARWRSIALLAAVILGYPLSLLWQKIFFIEKVESPTYLDVTVINIAFFLLVWVLLGVNRLKGFIAASFTFSIINISHIPVSYIMLIIFYPLTDKLGWVETFRQYPQIYYCAILIHNINIAVFCFLAARWLRASNKKLSVKLYTAFNLLFVLFPLGVLLFWEDISTKMSISFITSSIIGLFFLGILVFLFYLYTRLTTDKLTSGIKEKVDEYAQLIQRLSKREQEVVEAIVAGNKRYKELAVKLNISVNTVKFHLKNIYQTTGVSNLSSLETLLLELTSSSP